MPEIMVKKLEKVTLSIEQIENYLKEKGWKFDAGAYRSPNGGNIGLDLICGEQMTIDALAAFERRPSWDIAQAALELDRGITPLPN